MFSAIVHYTCSVCIIDDYQVRSVNDLSGALQNDDEPEVLAEGMH